MKKILRDILFLVMGGIVVNIIGITATTYVLSSNEVKYTDPDGNVKDVQQSIEELYVKLDNVATNVKTLPTGVKAIIYLDPTDLTKECNQFNSTIGGTGTKNGCMKWYAFKEDDTSYTMILDHNTIAGVAWNSDNVNTSKKEIQTELDKLYPPEEETPTNWKVKPRLITAQEVADITGNTNWNQNFFDFDANCKSGCSTGENKYYWLFDYTTGCISRGCKVADNSNEGYWTDTLLPASTVVWTVRYHGSLNYNTARNTGYGIRPVITVQKSNL